ncbi:MAG: hypothetical protein E7668_00500 [Ruminococcaceae bacterium]|nr:hypothetical protein [Oscillospiraceae bacterium]
MSSRRNEKKTKKFKLFDMNRDGKGVYEVENRKPTLKFFFILFKRKFTQLLQLNLLMLFQIIPILIIAGLYFMGTKTPSVTDALYAPLYGISKIHPSPALTSALDMAGIQMELPIFSPWATALMIGLILFLALTFGWQNVGAKYVLRGLFRGDAVFVFSDYFYAIKRNLKQAFWLGLLDFLFSAVLIIDFIFFYFRTGSFGTDFMYFAIFAIGLLYLVMRFYMYHLLITFDLKNWKILKNSLIFTVLGIKRNLMAGLGILLLLGLHVLLIILLVPMGVAVPLVLPLVYLLAVIGFITTYAAYPVIDRYMIAPYQTQEAIPSEASDEIEATDETESECE